MYIYTHTHTHTHMHACTSTPACIHTYANIHAHTHIHVCIYKYIYSVCKLCTVSCHQIVVLIVHLQ